jgi:F420-dependent oxidoreductase-like protein
MEFRLVLGYHWYGSYRDVLESARAAERAGFTAIFRGDHLLSVDGKERSVTEGYLTLAGLARETRRIRFGMLVSPVTFRSPALLMRMVATLDEMSEGRIELGLGAGWYEAEHDAIGIPLPSVRERFDRLEEQLAIVRGLWSGKPFTFEGRYHQLRDATLPARWVQTPPPLLVGGQGKPRTIALAARYADELNLDQLEPPGCREALDRLDVALDAIGRPRDAVIRSNAASWLPGDLDAQRERIAAFEAAGVQRLYIKRRPDAPLSEIAAFGRDVIGG